MNPHNNTQSTPIPRGKSSRTLPSNFFIVRRPIAGAPIVRGGFSLVELLVVVGIIGLLMSILLPAMTLARRQANIVECAAHLKEVGDELMIYSNTYDGWVIPVGQWIPKDPLDMTDGYWDTLGTEMCADPTTPWDGNRVPRPLDERWPYLVWGQDYPAVLHCPEDPQITPLPAPYYSFHSYILNKHLAVNPVELVRFFAPSNLRTVSDTIVMGEKISWCHDYYMEGTVDQTQPNNEYETTVETNRHGTNYGSNYLFLDWHVSNMTQTQILNSEDPWDVFQDTQNLNMTNTE